MKQENVRIIILATVFLLISLYFSAAVKADNITLPIGTCVDVPSFNSTGNITTYFNQTVCVSNTTISVNCLFPQSISYLNISLLGLNSSQVENELITCKERYASLNNASGYISQQYEICTNKTEDSDSILTSCQSDLRSTQGSLSSARTEKDRAVATASQSTQNNFIMGAVVGVGIGAVLWYKKSKYPETTSDLSPP